MDLQPLTLRDVERAAAKRYADALAGKALAFRRWELGEARRIGLVNYFFAAMIAGISNLLAATMADSGLRTGTTDGEVAFLFAAMFGGPLAFALGTWVWRGRSLRALARLEGLERLPEEQTIVDDPVESFAYRVVRLVEAFNADNERLSLERDGVAVGDLAPDAERDAYAERLARLRSRLEDCQKRMRFWRSFLARSFPGVRPSLHDTSEIDKIEREYPAAPAALARA